MKTLVTGANGFIGRHVCAELTRQGNLVLAMLRKPEEQFKTLNAQVNELGGNCQLIEPVHGDVKEPNLGLKHPLPALDSVIHLAAKFEWKLDPAIARQINVEGSLAVAELCAKQRCPMIFISGFMMADQAYMEGIGIGSSDPGDVNWASIYKRVGAYEASKMEAALRVREVARQQSILLSEVQPATVAGHSKTGELDEAQPLYTLFRNLLGGKLALVPGSSDHWLPLVAVDHLARVISALVISIERPSQVLALDPSTPTLKRMLSVAAESVGTTSPNRHIPLGVLRQFLRIPAVAKYMNTPPEALNFIGKNQFSSDSEDALLRLHGMTRPDIDQVIRKTAIQVDRGQHLRNQPS